MTSIKKELILIHPPVGNYLIRLNISLLYGDYVPHSLHILAALTPKEYKVRFICREPFWRKKECIPGSLVGITCVTSSAPQAYALADRYREAGAFVVMGGLHVSALPEEALAHCHSVVIGEAESAWPQVLKDFEAGSLKRIYRGELLEDFFSPVYEYFLSLPPKQFRRAGLLVQRGCKYNCEFCGNPAVKIRFVKVEQVVALAQRAAQGRFFGWFRKPTLMLIGDNIYADPAYTKNLLQAIRHVPIRWFAGSSLDIAFDDGILTYARESGCKLLLIGFETIHPRDFVKTSVHDISSAKDYSEAISRIKSHGIPVVGCFIAGLDTYTHRDYLQLLRFLARPMRFYFASVNMLTPFPGSSIRERFLKEGRLKSAGWGAHNLIRILFRPAHMSAFSLFLWFAVTKAAAFFMSRVGLIVVVLLLNIQVLYSTGLIMYLREYLDSVALCIYTFFFAVFH